jgi:hypothetical protein
MRKGRGMAKPTHEDADLLLRLVQTWPSDATDWMWSDEFITDHSEFEARYGRDVEAHGKLRAVLNWWETIGTLHKHGLLNEDLLFDWLAIDHTWERLKSHALGWRQEIGDPAMYENFEAMALAFRRWRDAHDRKAA